MFFTKRPVEPADNVIIAPGSPIAVDPGRRIGLRCGGRAAMRERTMARAQSGALAETDTLAGLLLLRGWRTFCQKSAKSEWGANMAEEKVTVEQLPNGKWACFLHLPGHDEPINLGREFKNDEQAENWLNVSEAVTAIDMMVRKHKK